MINKLYLIENIINFFNKPYGLLSDSRIKFILSTGLPLFILFFLWTFGPFGLILFQDFVRLKLLSVITIIGAIIIIIHVYFFQNIVIKNYTIGVTIIWIFWITLLIGLSNFIIYEIFFNNPNFHWSGLPFMLYQTFLIGLLPYLFIIILYNTYYLRNKIRVINRINSELTGFQNNHQTITSLTLTSSNLRDVVTIDSNSLICVISADNYVELNWFENGQTKKMLLRNTLAEVENKINKQVSHIQRCHNSYIVNINQIKTILGNSGGYRIILNKIDLEIPISRKYKNRFFELLKINSL